MKHFFDQLSKYWFVITGTATIVITCIVGVTRLYDTVYTTKTDVGLIKPDLAEVKGKVNWIVEKIEATTGEKYTAKK